MKSTSQAKIGCTSKWEFGTLLWPVVLICLSTQEPMGWVGISHCNHTFQFHKMFLIVKFALHLIVVNLEIIFFRKDHLFFGKRRKSDENDLLSSGVSVGGCEWGNGRYLPLQWWHVACAKVYHHQSQRSSSSSYRHYHHLIVRFYWKIIIDPAAGSGVAIVGVNKHNHHH